MRSKDELEDLINEVEFRIQSRRTKILVLKKELEEEETKLIQEKILIDKYNEELRVFNSRQINVELTPRQIEINEFKTKVPEILERLKNEKLR